MTADLCIARHAKDADRPRRALPGLYLCYGHRAQLVQLIAEMPAAYTDLDRPPTPGPRGHGSGESRGLAVDTAAADLRRQMAGTFASWCRVIAEDRGINPPAGPEISRTAPYLVHHAEWLAAQPFVDELLVELRDLRSNARRLTDLPARKVPLEAPCLVHADGQRCPGTVTIVVRGDEWLGHCPACRERHKAAGTRYEPQDATPYVRALSRPGQHITTDGVIRLAHLAGVPCSPEVVWQWRHRGKITGQRGTDGEVRFDLKSVHDYLAKRERIAS
jgi:hypothetical protein